MTFKITRQQRVCFLIVFFIFVALIGIMYGSFTPLPIKKVQKLTHLPKKTFAAIPITPTPTVTPTPTSQPSPTEPVYTGYCLNVPVLMYHHTAPSGIAHEKGFSSLNVDSGIFDEQMGYIASHGY